jgi:AcrR family transcriptional regulator
LPTPPLPRNRGPKAVKVNPRVLLEAALTVFARDGLQASSLRAIAREAGCDPSLIYYHFQNKEDMFRALVEERMPPVVEALRRLAGPEDRRSCAEKCWAIQGIFHSSLQASTGFRSLVRGEMVRGAAGIKEILAGKMVLAAQSIRAIFEDGVRQGQVRPGIDPFLMTFFLVRMEFEILDLVPTVAMPIGGIPPEEAVRRAERTWFEVFWRGVAARPDEPLPFLPPFPENA